MTPSTDGQTTCRSYPVIGDLGCVPVDMETLWYFPAKDGPAQRSGSKPVQPLLTQRYTPLKRLCGAQVIEYVYLVNNPPRSGVILETHFAADSAADLTGLAWMHARWMSQSIFNRKMNQKRLTSASPLTLATNGSFMITLES